MQPVKTILGSLTLTAILLFQMVPVRSQVLNESKMDLWDVSEGNQVTANSPVHQLGFDIRQIFGFVPTGSAETNSLVFADGQNPGFEHFVEWKTPVPISLRSFLMLFAHDPGESGAERRGLSRFTLLAKSGKGGNFDTKIFELFPSDPYADTPVPPESTLHEADSNELRLCVEVAEIQAQEFRAEFVQSGVPVFGGPRVIELDGFSTSSCGKLIKYPQIALGGGYEIVAIGSNERDQDWNGMATLYQGNAEAWETPWSLDGEDMSGASSFPIALSPDETRKFVLTTADPIRSGYLVITPQPGFDTRDVVVSFFYNFLSGGILADSTGTPPSAPAKKFVFPVEFQSGAAGINTGLAWAPVPGDRCLRCEGAVAGQ